MVKKEIKVSAFPIDFEDAMLTRQEFEDKEYKTTVYPRLLLQPVREFKKTNKEGFITGMSEIYDGDDSFFTYFDIPEDAIEPFLSEGDSEEDWEELEERVKNYLNNYN